jgi:hypothetical protein
MHSQLMHNKQRYQAKIHTISAKLFKRKNKNLHIFTIFFNGKQQKHASTVMKIKLNSTYGKIKPVHKEKGWNLPI